MGAVLDPDIVHRGDVGVVERRSRARLLLEARQPLRVAGEFARQHLDRHLAPEPSVLGQPHFAHASGPELLENLVGTGFGASFHGSPVAVAVRWRRLTLAVRRFFHRHGIGLATWSEFRGADKVIATAVIAGLDVGGVVYDPGPGPDRPVRAASALNNGGSVQSPKVLPSERLAALRSPSPTTEYEHCAPERQRLSGAPSMTHTSRHGNATVFLVGLALIVGAFALSNPTANAAGTTAPAPVPATPAAQAGGQQEGPTNLQVLSSDLTRRELFPIMRGFAAALGVRCEYCHVGEPGADLSTFDFASDEKEHKKIARVMLKMVNNINSEHLHEAQEARGTHVHGDPVQVSCYTCHHGASTPTTLVQTLTVVLEHDGVEATMARYDELRAEYYGAATYDFTAGSLAELAQGREHNVAMAILGKNIELFPDYVFNHAMAGQVHMDAGHTDLAKAAFEKCVALDAEARPCVRGLAALARDQ